MSIIPPFVSAYGTWPALPPSSDADDLLNYARNFSKATQDRCAELARRINEEILQGTVAQRPTANGSKRFYFATDTNTLYYDAGTWQAVTGAGGSTDVLLADAFMPREQYTPTSRAGSGITVTRDALGYVIAATGGVPVDDATNILSTQIFGG